MLETYHIDDVLTEELVEQLKGRPFGFGSRARDLDGFEIYEDPLRHWTILTGEEEAARWVEVQIERRVEEYFSQERLWAGDHRADEAVSMVDEVGGVGG